MEDSAEWTWAETWCWLSGFFAGIGFMCLILGAAGF